MASDFSGDWAGIKQRYDAWWKGENEDGPIMGIMAPRYSAGVSGVNDKWVASSSDENNGKTSKKQPPKQELSEEICRRNYTDFDTLLQRNLAVFDMMCAIGDGFPRIFSSLGPVGLAAYLGAEPIFREDTVWYHPILKEACGAKLKLDLENPWLNWSLDCSGRLRAAEQGRYITAIPELCEQVDVLSTLLGSEKFLLDLYDSPDDVHRLLRIIHEAWIKTYDLHYQLLKDEEGFCCYGPFALLGKGKTAKIQCDMSATLSSDMYREFVLPYLTELTEYLDNSLYHLDGPEALRHLDDILSMKNLKALQWTPGAGNPDGGAEDWDFIYEKALNAGKNIYALVHPRNIGRFVKRFGSKGVYIVTQATGPEMANQLLALSKVKK